MKNNYFANQIDRFLIMEEKWASDGGYYGGDSDPIITVSQKTADYINGEVASLKQQLFSGKTVDDEVVTVTSDDWRNNSIKSIIINKLFKDHYLDSDTVEPGVEIFWIRPEFDKKEVEEEFDLIAGRFYDRVDPNKVDKETNWPEPEEEF